MAVNLADPKTRKVILTFTAAGLAAVFGEHLLKPGLRRRLKL